MRRRFGAVAAAAFAALPTCATRAHATPVEPRYAFETAWDNVNGGRWYRDENNETATLAWGEAYVLRGLIAMYRATGESEYLLRLADQADGVLAHTDAARGTPDFTGAAEPCWQDRHYQANGEAYCYVVHSGMILAPLVEAAVLVVVVLGVALKELATL